MALRKLITTPLPEPPEEETTIGSSLFAQALAMPQLIPVRLFLDNLLALRPWWPVLVPLMLWVGIRTYQRERAAVRSGE